MRRREFIAGLGGAAAWPLVARAQQPAFAGDGFLSGSSAPMDGSRRRPSDEGLNERLRGGSQSGDRIPLGGGKRPSTRWRSIWFAEGRGDRGSRWRHRRFAAKAATATIPIVFAAVPIQSQRRSRRQPEPAWRQHNGH